MQRESLKSRLGFILISAGCAIGVGNVWKFPYMVGQHGGGAFVLLYLFFLVILGIPVLTMEFALGRATKKSPVHLYQQIEPQGTKWHWHGYISLVGNFLLMMFYTTVAGWMLRYFFLTSMGTFEGLTPDQIAGVFGSVCGDPFMMGFYVVLVVVLGFLVCSIGLQKGVERVTTVMMIALLAIISILAVHSCLMENAAKGIEFYLKPDFSKINIDVVVGAMNQAFFTLSLGMGSMAIFGSYIDRTHSLLGESTRIAFLDTFVAIVAGFIIFPACAAFNVAPDSGPNLIFITLPNIFANMPLGRLWGTLFFLFLTFAAFSTIIAVFENIVSCMQDLTGKSRKSISFMLMLVLSVLSLPCALGFNLLSGFQPFGAGSGVLDLEDFLVSNLILPTGALTYVLFITIGKKHGWGWDNFVNEANAGKGLKVKKWMRPYVAYVLPLIILSVFVVGLLSFFKII